MNPKQDRLIQTAAQLYTLGLDVEEAREELRRLVSRKVPYGSPQMIAALTHFKELKAKWDDLEKQYLRLRKDVQKSSPF